MRDKLDLPPPETGGFRLRVGHVLATLIAFFGVVFLVNGYFLSRALSTHSGVVAIEPYRKGLAYNERIEADVRQAALGWRDVTQLAGPARLAVTISDRDGTAIPALHIKAQVGRPSTGAVDRTLQLREETPGRYTADTGVLEPGSWLVTLEIRTSDSARDPVYRAKRRLWLKP